MGEKCEGNMSFVTFVTMPMHPGPNIEKKKVSGTLFIYRKFLCSTAFCLQSVFFLYFE